MFYRIDSEILSNPIKLQKIKHWGEDYFAENKNIFKRVNEIHKIAELLNKNNEKMNFSNLLFEITKRTLNENKFESNLFFL